MSPKKWTANHLPNLKGKTAVITGANTGLGYQTARLLAAHQAEVVIACRNLEKGQNAVSNIKLDFPSAKLKMMVLDLADLMSIKNFVKEFNSTYASLDLLINNAGVMMTPYAKTANGFELQLGTNHLGHFALTGLLLAKLLAGKQARIINVSSIGHRFAKLNLNDLNWEKRKYDPMQSYADTKLANLLFTYALQRKLAAAGADTIVAAAHPGLTATDLQRHSSVAKFFNPWLAQKAEKGALPILYAATHPNVQRGDYFGPGGWLEMRGYPKKVSSTPLSHDDVLAEDLWNKSEELTNIHYSFAATKKVKQPAAKR